MCLSWSRLLTSSLEALAYYLDAKDLRLSVVKRRRGFALKHKDEPVALVCATHARLPTGSRIDGDFLSPGYHWTALRKRLIAQVAPPAKPVVAPDPAMAPVQTMLTRFPSGFGDAIAARAEEASEHIRHDRFPCLRPSSCGLDRGLQVGVRTTRRQRRACGTSVPIS